MDSMDETTLLERLRQGDEAAFELLVRMYGGRMLAVARGLLRNEEDARDVVQGAYISAFRGLPAFKGTSQLSTWLHRIVVNGALMKLRTRRRKPEESIEELLPAFLEDGHHVDSFCSWAAQADRLLEHKQMRQAVRAAIAELPDTYRAVLVLRDIEDMTTDEAAAALGITSNAVKIRLHRARQALATLVRRRMGNRSERGGIEGTSCRTFPVVQTLLRSPSL
jgi:RNA polymerase sigma-70 factor (ECF subfamily)